MGIRGFQFTILILGFVVLFEGVYFARSNSFVSLFFAVFDIATGVLMFLFALMGLFFYDPKKAEQKKPQDTEFKVDER
jgi:uncharacterized SAM-binding protein YcdF (DUF218 family)